MLVFLNKWLLAFAPTRKKHSVFNKKVLSNAPNRLQMENHRT